MTTPDDKLNQIKPYWPSPFFTIWCGQSLAMITSETVQFALIWWLTASYGSATVVSFATIMALLPRALFSPFMGALVDRWNRRRVLIISNVIIILALACLGVIFKTGNASIGSIYAIILVCAFSKSFQMPAMLSSTSLMVPPKHLSRVAGLNQMIQGFMRIVAPALGAVLVRILPMFAIVTVDIGGSFFAIMALITTTIPNPASQATEETTSTAWKTLWKDVRMGVEYVWHWVGAKEMLTISTTINFLSCPAFMLTSILVTKRFGGSVREFGIIGAAIGIGMICGGILLSFWNGFRRPMQTTLMGVLGMSSALLLIGVTPASSFWLAVAAMFIGGLMIPICMAPIQALIQKTVEPTMQGRVLTLLDSISTAISPLSLAMAGPIFDHLGPQVWYISSGVLGLLIGLLGFTTSRFVALGTPPAKRKNEPATTTD